MVKQGMRYIYISPHLDDAVLSAGGLIRELVRAGHEVQIWNVMCSIPPHSELSPFAQMLHAQWGIESAADVVTARRAEDARAAAVVGAKTVYLDFYDCIYRKGSSGEWMYGAIFVPPHVEEAELPAQIARDISSRLEPNDVMFCQLAIGGHVDHILTRAAVELLNGWEVEYLADIPYHIKAPDEMAVKTQGMEQRSHLVSDEALEAWKQAISAYESQISSLFTDLDDMRAKIQAYSVESGGLRTWKKRA